MRYKGLSVGGVDKYVFFFQNLRQEWQIENKTKFKCVRVNYIGKKKKNTKFLKMGEFI